MTRARMAMLVTASICSAGAPPRAEPQAGHSPLVPAVAALSLVRSDSTFLPRHLTSDSILVDIDGAYQAATADTAISLDSLASLVSMRMGLRPYWSCGASADMTGRLRRAACAFRSTQYYLELTEVDMRADSAFVTVVAFRHVPAPPQRERGAVATLKRALGRQFGKERSIGTTVNMQQRMVRLRREGDEWRALGFVPL
jgi:hypothetical protein